MLDPVSLYHERLGKTAERFFLISKERRQQIPEGEVNASLGAACAFFGFIGLLLALPASMITLAEESLPGMGIGQALAMVVSGLVSSGIGLLLGRRARRVTRRRLRLTQFGIVVAIPSIAISIVALLVSLIRAST